MLVLRIQIILTDAAGLLFHEQLHQLTPDILKLDNLVILLTEEIFDVLKHGRGGFLDHLWLKILELFGNIPVQFDKSPVPRHQGDGALAHKGFAQRFAVNLKIEAETQ